MKINNKLIFIIIIIVLIAVIGFKFCKKENTDNTNTSKENVVTLENKIENVINTSKENTETKNQAESNLTTSSEERVIKITKDNFEEKVINSKKIVIVDFWASWCTPCKLMTPILEEIAEENENIIIGKVNVDEEIALSEEYGITMIPTMIIFKDGAQKETIIGLNEKDKILEYIEKIK